MTRLNFSDQKKQLTTESWSECEGYRHEIQNVSNSDTVFPHIVAAETILFWIYKILKLHIFSTSYVMKTWIVSSLGAETIQGWKLFKGGNYMRKYGNSLLINSWACPTVSDLSQSYGLDPFLLANDPSTPIYLEYIGTVGIRPKLLFEEPLKY